MKPAASHPHLPGLDASPQVAQAYPHARDPRRKAVSARPAPLDPERFSGDAELPGTTAPPARPDGKPLWTHHLPLGADVAPLVLYDQTFPTDVRPHFTDHRPTSTDAPPAR